MTPDKIDLDVLSQITNTVSIPSEEAVAALLAAEKNTKKARNSYSFTDLVGTWKLRFVTGTKKTRAKAGVVLGAGKYLPKLLDIGLTYTPVEESVNRVLVANCVDFKLLKFTLSGPVEFMPKQNILAFDFTQMELKFAGITLYKGYVSSGEEREANFYNRGIQKKPFFVYFLVQSQLIAARGKGGGLAIWVR